MIKKIFMFSLLLASAFIFIGCDDKEVVENGDDETKDVLKDLTDISLVEGDIYTFDLSEDLILSSNKISVVTVDDATKSIVAVGEGSATVTVYLLSDTSISKEINVTVTPKEDNPGGEDNPGTKPEDVKVTGVEIISSVETIYIDEVVTLEAKVLPENANQEIKWSALNRTKATIDENGTITPLRKGEAKFVASSVQDPTIKAEITINILDTIDPEKFFTSFNFEKPVVQNFTAYGWQGNWDGTLLGSVTKYMFEDISIVENMLPEGHADRPGKAMKPIYITVHDVGGTNASENAEGTSRYCHTPKEVSWHFSIGNDGIWQQLPWDEIGWHAGDGTKDPLEFYDTGVKATSKDPAVVTISSDGYFEMNGEKSTVKAPTNADGGICKTSELPYTGVNNYVNPITGTYWVGKTYWNKTYHTLANRGGNLNSIGIETCVNRGSNVFYTWNITAKFIGEIALPQTGLTPNDVKQHNTFSGKNCPQTMRTAKMWETFMEIVETEYLVYKYFRSWDIEFICDSPYIGANGLIKGLPEAETTINYQIKVNDKMGYEKTFDFSFVLPARAGYRV